MWKQSTHQIVSSPYNYVTHLFHDTKKLAFLELFKDKMTIFAAIAIF